jgi:hypothetical protein
MAHYVVCPQKKIISRIFKISGALIVKNRYLSKKKKPRRMMRLERARLWFRSAARLNVKKRKLDMFVFYHYEFNSRNE